MGKSFLRINYHLISIFSEPRLPNRRQKNQNNDAKNHGEGTNVSERDHGRDAKQPSSGDQKSNVSENHIGGDGEEKFDDDNKDNGAEGYI